MENGVNMMARAPNEKIKEAYTLFKQGLKLVDIASKLELPAGTIRRWKSTYKWDGENKSERSDKNSERSKRKNDKKEEVITKEMEEVVEGAQLTEKQKLFCIYYIRTFNGTKSYQKAYQSSYEVAAVESHRLLKNPKIKKVIEELKKDKLSRELLSEEDIFQKYVDIAFADMTDFVDITKYGITIKPAEQIDGTLINEISSNRDGVKIKLADRMKALQWLSSHIENSGEIIADDGFLEALNSKYALIRDDD